MDAELLSFARSQFKKQYGGGLTWVEHYGERHRHLFLVLGPTSPKEVLVKCWEVRPGYTQQVMASRMQLHRLGCGTVDHRETRS